MRILQLTLVLLLASLAGASAQVSVEILLDQQQFLRDESLPVKVRVTNRSGQTLKLGGEPDWLTFTVDGQEGVTATRLSDPDVVGEFSLDSALAATRTVDLMPHYDFSQPGRYVVTATVKIKQWNDELASKPKPIEIVRGTRLWEQEFGLPTTGGAPEVRKYTLQQANYLKHLELYVRVTDPTENKVFRVFPIGPLVSFSRPEAQVDKESNLHVLCQTGARSFAYHVVNPDGGVLTRQTHDYTATRPVLRVSDTGKIFVWGGARRMASTDIPPSPAPGATFTNAPAGTPDLAPTNAPPRKPTDAKSKNK
jgi:hypothetical protein